MSNSKPYPKISPNAMREDARAKQSSWHSPQINRDKMQSEAKRNQQDHSNLSNPTLNGMDKKVGPIKGGC